MGAAWEGVSEERSRDSDLPAHLAVTDPAHPGPGEGRIGQQGYGAQGISREVGAHRAEDDEEEGSRGPADT